MPPRRKPSSILEVARQAGVSPATVSRVLTGQRRHIAPETRDRVLAAVSRLDYSPNALARSLATRRAPILAALVHDISDPYFGEITQGIETVAGDGHHVVMVCNWLREPDRLLRSLRLLRTMRVAGVVFCGSGIAEDQPLHAEICRQIALLRRDGTRMVALAPQPVEMPSVMIDNQAAAAMAVEHLLSHGHRRIGHLAGPAMLLTARLRREGYRRTLEQVGVAAPDRWIEWAGFQVAEGYEGARRLLARAPELTAIFAANDQLAIGAIAAAEALGRAVPSSLSITGIGDIPIMSFLRPSLTTVAVPTRTLGEEAAAFLLRPRPGRGSDGDLVRLLPVSVVVRQSVAAAGIP